MRPDMRQGCWILIAVSVACGTAHAGLIASSGVLDTDTNVFYDVDTVTPSPTSSTDLPYSQDGDFDISNPGTDPATSFLDGGFGAVADAQYGHLSALIGGGVDGGGAYPDLTIYASAFFTDTFTFTTSAPSGTAFFYITMDGSGSISGDHDVSGKAYGGLLAGEVGSDLTWQYPDVTDSSVSTVLKSQPIPFTSGVPVNVEVGLAANIYFRCNPTPDDADGCVTWGGDGETDFSHTAVLTGIVLLDSNGNPIDSFNISSGSGTVYTASGVVPEPSTLGLALAGILMVAGWCRFRNSILQIRVPINEVDSAS